jgi:hypothetical protein
MTGAATGLFCRMEKELSLAAAYLGLLLPAGRTADFTEKLDLLRKVYAHEHWSG